jgi:hypothetical protein
LKLKNIDKIVSISEYKHKYESVINLVARAGVWCNIENLFWHQQPHLFIFSGKKCIFVEILVAGALILYRM